MSKQHTPYRLNSDFIEIIDSEGNIIVDCITIEQAEFIVKACNNHDRLVKALDTFSILNEYAPEFRCIAGLIKNARKLLTELKA